MNAAKEIHEVSPKLLEVLDDLLEKWFARGYLPPLPWLDETGGWRVGDIQVSVRARRGARRGALLRPLSPPRHSQIGHACAYSYRPFLPARPCLASAQLASSYQALARADSPSHPPIPPPPRSPAAASTPPPRVHTVTYTVTYTRPR